jgi:hypothetical protein
MNQTLQHDLENLTDILEQTFQTASQILQQLETRPVAVPPHTRQHHNLPEDGLGFSAALEQVFGFCNRWHDPCSIGGRLADQHL